MTDDLKFAQLLCTRLCHDLAGPIGAVSAGVELMGSDPSLIDDETLSLLSGSAESGSLKLKFLRIAFGWSGSGSSALDQVNRAFQDYVAAIAGPSGAPTLTWAGPEGLGVLQTKLGDDSTQVLANIVLLGLEAQPKCGSLSLRIEPQGAEVIVEVVNTSADGQVRVRDEILAAVQEGGGPSMSPQSIQAHLTRRLMAAHGGQLAIKVVSDGVITTVGRL